MKKYLLFGLIFLIVIGGTIAASLVSVAKDVYEVPVVTDGLSKTATVQNITYVSKSSQTTFTVVINSTKGLTMRQIVDLRDNVKVINNATKSGLTTVKISTPTSLAISDPIKDEPIDIIK